MSRTTTSSRPRRRPAALVAELLEDRTVPAAGVGVFNPATDVFYLRNSASPGPADSRFQLPAPGNLPVVGDWNGDARDDFAVFDRATATWSLKYGTESGPADAGTFQFGTAGALPVAGDWDGDGRDGIGVHTAVLGRWALRQTADAGAADAGVFRFGLGGMPVAGDWNGDGIDGIGFFNRSLATWALRQTPNAGAANAGVFRFGPTNTCPVAGDFAGPAAPADAIATVELPPLNLDLLGLEVRTSPITVTVSTETGDGKLLGNLLDTVSNVVNLNEASNAVNTVLGSTVRLLNSATMGITGLVAGPLDDAPAGATQVLELWVAPVHLDLLGAVVTTSPIRVTITARAGDGLVLGNVVTALTDLFNPPLPDRLDVDFLNQKLNELLATLNDALPGVTPAPTPPVPIGEGQILNLTVPPLDLDLLGLAVETSPITVNASAETGDGFLLGNVLTTALKTLGATPQNLSELNTNINAILAKVVGALNAADLTLPTGALDALPAAIRALLDPVLTAPAAGATAPVLDLLIASTDGTTPPVNVELLGLVVTTSHIEAHIEARTGDGQVLGNLLYNLANLADPGGPASLLSLLNRLGSGALNTTDPVTGGPVTPTAPAPEELLTVTLKPLDLDLLGLEVKTDPITVTVSTQGGDGKLLGNLLGGIASLLDTENVSNALNNVLDATVDLVNSVSLSVSGVLPGTFDDAAESVTPVLDLFVAPVHLDLLGAVVTTSPIHLTITARSGQGLVLGNVVAELADLFNPPLPDQLDIDFLNERLAQLLTRLNEQIPTITPAPVPSVQLGEDQFLGLTVPMIDLNLLGLVLQTSPITVNAFTQPGDGQLLGNVLTTVLNTLGATPENLTGLNNNLNALLAKVVGVLNAADLILPPDPLAALPRVLQILGLPTLIAPAAGVSTQILDLVISTRTGTGSPVQADLLGLVVTTSNIDAQLLAVTGEGQVLGNLLYNVANLLNNDGATTLLFLLSQLALL